MTAEELLAKAKTWILPPGRRSTASYAAYGPTIAHLAAQGWRAVHIKEALTKELQLSASESSALYHHILRRLRPTNRPTPTPSCTPLPKTRPQKKRPRSQS